MALLDRVAEYFYDPAVFWGVPLALEALRAAVRALRARRRRLR